MKIICLFIIQLFIFSFNSLSQASRGSQQKTAAAKPSLKNTSDSLKMAVNDAKESFNTIFKGHRDTASIIISNIEYEDPNLQNLKENLKKLKGVKSVSEQYKSSNAVLKIPFKGKPTDLWDELPMPVKAPFKLIEASDNFISLKFKNDTGN
ncbi:MAG: hypothetical protein ACTHK0_05235 [Ginsengibacter sp.]